MINTQIREVIEEINCINKHADSNHVLTWIAEDWDNYEFRNYIESLDNQLEVDDVIYDKRNLLAIINKNEDLNIKKDIIVKDFKLTRRYDIFRFRFLKSKAIRSLKIALALKKIGINTPKPVAVIEKRDRFNKILFSYFITEYIDYDYNLLDIIKDAKHPLRNRIKNILPEIARNIRRMHDAGIIHNDLHAGNILVKDIENNPKFYYIDLNRGRIKKNLKIRSRMKDLSRFKLKSDEQEVFIENYAPNKSKELLDLLIKERDKRIKFLDFRRRLKKKIKRRD